VERLEFSKWVLPNKDSLTAPTRANAEGMHKVKVSVVGKQNERKPFEWDFHLHAHYNAHKIYWTDKETFMGLFSLSLPQK
jgi:hypothetical protein